MRILLIGLMTLQLAFSYSGLQSYSDDSVRKYLSQLSSMMAGRPLNESELSQIEANPPKALHSILETWSKGSFFAESARLMIQTQLTASGNASGVNFNLPGNLARFIARYDLPYSQILTADFCVDDNDQKVSCDTGAPFNAGVLTTKAYMIRNMGRFNLSRAGRLLKQFSCREYPMETSIQVPIKRERLIPMFQVVEGSPNAEFGNGLACYSCHSQFGAHAQFFVKFDHLGNYRPDATGQQDPAHEAGISFDGLFTSHMIDPVAAQSEESQMYGQTAENLQQAAKVIVASDLFLECSVKNTMKHFLRMADSDTKDVDLRIVREITGHTPSPEAATLQQIVLATLTHPTVIESVLLSGEDQ